MPSGDESSTTSTSTRSGRASRRASTHSIVSRSSYVGRMTRVRRRSGDSGSGDGTDTGALAGHQRPCRPRRRARATGTNPPSRTYGVTTSDERIVCRRIAVRNKPTSATTRPLGSMNALMPETAAFTTHRPFSTARIRLICRCCADAAVVPYDALFTGTTRNPAPSRTNSRVREGKLFSKQIGVPNAGSALGRHGVHPLPRRPVDRDLRDRRDPRQLVPPRHVLAERHQVHLVVAVDRLPRSVQQDHARVLRPVGIVEHGAHERRGAHRGDRGLDVGDRLGVVGRPRIERPLPPHGEVRRIGGELARGARYAAARRPRPPRPRRSSPPAGRRPATSRRRGREPFGTENGISSGARIRTAAATQQPARAPAHSPAADRRLHQERVHRQHDERHTPHARDRRQAAGRPDRRPGRRPSEPQLKPPSGQAVRTQSVTVHSDASPTAVSSGWPRRWTAGANSPNTTAEPAQSSVIATHAISPNRPDPVEGGAVAPEAEHEPQDALLVRPPAERSNHRNGATPTNATRPPSEGRRTRRTRAARSRARSGARRGREGRALRRNPGRASSSCLPAGSGV